MLEHVHDKANYRLPLKNMAYLLYNMCHKGVYDPVIYEKFEENYQVTSSEHMRARFAYGGLFAYYRSNQGTMFGIDFWESKLEDCIDGMRAQWVLGLLEAFKDNRKLHRDHMREKLDSQFKKVILDNWHEEVEFHQKLLCGLANELHDLEWYDEEVWTKIVQTAARKKKIQNLHIFIDLHKHMVMLNNDKDKPFYGKFNGEIDTYMKKHYNQDRKWKYDAEKLHKNSLQDLIDRREEATIDKFALRKAATDDSVLELARMAERRLKRLRMAKYSTDLFDEIVNEMMREKRTIMEMMAELDVEDDTIFASQTRLAKKKQAKLI